MGCLTVWTGWTHRGTTTKVRHSFSKTLEAVSVCNPTIDNQYTHQKHSKGDSRSMPRKDFCLISFIPHSLDQNLRHHATGETKWGVKFYPTGTVTLITPEKSAFPSSQDAFEKLNQDKAVVQVF